MDINQLVIWIVIGGIAGLLADAVIKGVRIGLVGAIIVGILGAVIGGWLLGLLNLNLGDGILVDIIVAFIGACLLLLVLRALKRI